ncbi:hypothetical protein MTO96_051759 [Rhipicephalus appendiculatus]
MRILVVAVITLAMLTVASGRSQPEWDSNEAESSREDSQWSLSSIWAFVKPILDAFWKNLSEMAAKGLSFFFP